MWIYVDLKSGLMWIDVDLCGFLWPIRSVCMPYMVTFSININTPNVSIYTIHGSYGLYVGFHMNRKTWRLPFSNLR